MCHDSRRMVETAALLVDNVLPHRPVRQEEYIESKDGNRISQYFLNAVMRDNSMKRLSYPLPKIEQALYLEQEFERVLCIRDRRCPLPSWPVPQSSSSQAKIFCTVSTLRPLRPNGYPVRDRVALQLLQRSTLFLDRRPEPMVYNERQQKI